MLVLSILIVTAMGTAVISFLLDGSRWLLFVTVLLVVLAFLVSRRTSQRIQEGDEEPDPTQVGPAQAQLHIILDQRIALNLSGRHREPGELAVADDQPRVGNGPALTGA